MHTREPFHNLPTTETNISINSKKRKRFPYTNFAYLREIARNEKKEGKKSGGEPTSVLVVAASPFVVRRHCSSSKVCSSPARLSIQIHRHRPPPPSPTSCDIFNPTERPAVGGPAFLPPIPPIAANWNDEQGKSFLGRRRGETTSFCLWMR